MFSASYLCICIYCMLQLGLMLITEHRRRNTQTGNEKYFRAMLIITEFSFVANIFSNQYPQPAVLYPFAVMGVYAELILNTVLIPVFFLYVCTQISGLQKSYKQNMTILIIGLTVLCTLIILSTAFTKQIFYFDNAHIYHRGPLLIIPMSLQLIMMLIVEIFMISQKQKIDIHYFYALTMFLIAPLIGWILQFLIFGLPFSLLSITFAAQILFTDIRNRNMDKDYLTDAFNRQILDKYMQQKITAATDKKTFSAILMDIDNFKSINDCYGHFEGDLALEKTVQILRASVNRNDFVARYGGDEFCIILESDKEAELEDVVIKINNNLDEYNQKADKPYKLCFSLGYAVYNCSMGKSKEIFFKLIDQKMYDQKKEKKI